MKLMILSDIHGSSFYLKKAMDIYQKETCDKMILLGDVLYHGPRNDLPFGHAPKEVIALLNPMKEDIVAVKGNCEAEVDQMVLDFDVESDYKILELDGLKLFLTHGHHHNTNNLNTNEAFDVLLHGHTHIPAFEKKENYIYINPGSISIPKNDSKHSLIIYENRCFDFRDLDNNSYKKVAL